MASFNEHLSLCCFAPITEPIFLAGPVDESLEYYCSHCGKLAKDPISWPFGTAVTQGVELAIRRFADGDMPYEHVDNRIVELTRVVTKNLLTDIRVRVRDDKPDVWVILPGSAKWQKNEELKADSSS